MRLIDADALEPDTEWSEYYDGFISYSWLEINNAPTIETKQIKYFDEDEKVWKTGSIIVEHIAEPQPDCAWR